MLCREGHIIHTDQSGTQKLIETTHLNEVIHVCSQEQDLKGANYLYTLYHYVTYIHLKLLQWNSDPDNEDRNLFTPPEDLKARFRTYKYLQIFQCVK